MTRLALSALCTSWLRLVMVIRSFPSDSDGAFCRPGLLSVSRCNLRRLVKPNLAGRIRWEFRFFGGYLANQKTKGRYLPDPGS